MSGTDNGLPLALARQIGAVPDEKTLPDTPLDWAMRWASQGLRIFPCKRFLGLPLVEKWYTKATPETAQLVEWWSETPDADIAVVPNLSGHFVIVVAAPHGLDSLIALQDKHGELAPDFQYENRWGDIHLWFRGHALTSHDKLGPGLHVIGSGQFVYLPPSYAPDPWTE